MIKFPMKCGFLLLMVSNASATGWITDTVKEVSVKYGNGCVVLSNNEVIKIDVKTDVGKSEFSISLAAKASGKKIGVYKTDGILIGGCDSGDTIKPHSMLRIVD